MIFYLKTPLFLLTSAPNIDILIQSQRGFIFTGFLFWGLLKDESSFFVLLEARPAMFRRKIPSPFGPGAALPCKAEDRCCPAFKSGYIRWIFVLWKRTNASKGKKSEPGPSRIALYRGHFKGSISSHFPWKSIFSPPWEGWWNLASRPLSPCVKFSIQI